MYVRQKVMQEKLDELRNKIRQLSKNPDFIHHKWFYKWHLLIAEKIAMELCEKYPNADKDAVLGLIWVHDYGKIIDFDKQHDEENMVKVKDVLRDIGFSEKYIESLWRYLLEFESKMEKNLSKAAIEVQIASSADAASHMVGPFFAIYWHENPTRSIEELMQSNLKKLEKDWQRKITLPEIKEQFAGRYKYLREMFQGRNDRIIK